MTHALLERSNRNVRFYKNIHGRVSGCTTLDKKAVSTFSVCGADHAVEVPVDIGNPPECMCVCVGEKCHNFIIPVSCDLHTRGSFFVFVFRLLLLRLCAPISFLLVWGSSDPITIANDNDLIAPHLILVILIPPQSAFAFTAVVPEPEQPDEAGRTSSNNNGGKKNAARMVTVRRLRVSTVKTEASPRVDVVARAADPATVAAVLLHKVVSEARRR